MGKISDEDKIRIQTLREMDTSYCCKISCKNIFGLNSIKLMC